MLEANATFQRRITVAAESRQMHHHALAQEGPGIDRRHPRRPGPSCDLRSSHLNHRHTHTVTNHR
jgi:hypothetical protein